MFLKLVASAQCSKRACVMLALHFLKQGVKKVTSQREGREWGLGKKSSLKAKAPSSLIL